MPLPDQRVVLSNAARIVQLSEEIHALPPFEAAERVEHEPDDQVAASALALLNNAEVIDVLWHLPVERRERIVAAVPLGRGDEWLLHREYDEDTVGRLMERPLAVYRPETTVAAAVASLRELVQKALITYIFVTDDERRLVGVAAFRDLVFARPDQRLDEVMQADMFSFRPETELTEAMQSAVTRHFPAYPVTDDEGRLVGMVRGPALFERQAFEISAQPGSMVGVEKEERAATPWSRSFRFRHPWLQLNLLTSFVAAAVVGVFQDTVDKIVVLAAFLPVLAGQSGNSGCQALAVTLRSMTLGELRAIRPRHILLKEAWVGFLNGAIVGLVAGTGMWLYARSQGAASPAVLGAIVWCAMAASCVASGLAGTLVPLTLKRLGADPATASSIFLTTATDVVSMGLLLGLATMLAR
ncbi:MAG TPA: magnesium transporter [Thermoanaerobaculia bacterium]|nr:magnesium transporter [Thermoanaerobaculia bacterium]